MSYNKHKPKRQPMALPSMLLESYKIEFETTHITIAELCNKHKITPKQLPGYTKWKKDVLAIASLPAPASLQPPKPTNDEDDGLTLKEKIALSKELAINHVLSTLRDTRYLEIKEFKDLVSVLDALEKSTKDIKPEGVTLQVLIQNIINSTKDDC